MSKVSITGNASGSGTFTLAAPNSNSDRTLTLPDAAGTMFNQGNILGTVSESSGVPTGAIIERGSNANGEFVKFADGTQICTSVVQFDISSTSGSVQAYDFPVSFSGTSYVGSYSIGNSTGGAVTNAMARRAALRTRLQKWEMLLTSDSDTNPSLINLGLTAVGRWY